MRSVIMLVVLSALLNGITEGADKTKSEGITTLQDLTGEKLVKLLLNDKRCSEAYYELCRRKDPSKWKNFQEFQSFEFNRIAEVIVCPQGSGKPPLYAVLGKWDTVTERLQEETASAAKPPGLSRNHLEQKKGPLVFFTSEGKKVSPYKCDPDMLDGFIGDLNKDGLVERVQRLHFSPFNWEFDIAEVSVISEQPSSSVAVVYNWYPLSPATPFSYGEFYEKLQKERWEFRTADRNGDGLYEIEFGPKRGDTIKAELALRWDKGTGSYVCSKAKEGKHFQVVYPEDLRKSLGRIRIEGGGYKLPLLMFQAQQEQKGSKAYRYSSLKNLTNEQIVHYMGPGEKPPSAFERKAEVPSCLPKDFWNTPAKEAALALAETNRTLKNRRMYRLSIKDDVDQKPPDVCTLFFEYMANHGQFSLDFIVRCDPKGSHLLFVFQGYGYTGPPGQCTLCFLKLSYKEAKQIAHTVWWLKRIKSLPTRDEYRFRFSSSTSTADGRAQLQLISHNGRVVLGEWNRVWYARELSEGWSGDYDKEVFLNLAAHIIQKELVPYLREHYPGYQSEVGYYNSSDKKIKDQKRFKKFKEHIRKAFGLYSLDERNIPLRIVSLLVRQAGEMESEEFETDLQKLLDRLPPRDEKRLQELEEKRKKWEEEMDSFVLEAEELFDEAADANTIERSLSKDEDLELTEEDMKLERVEHLRDSIRTALKKINAGTNLKVLEQMAVDDLSWWAAERLKKADPNKYVKVLEGWLPKMEDWEQESIFKEIAEIKPERAKVIARKLRAEDTGNLAIVALEYLEEQDGEVVREGDPIIEAVIQTLLDPNVGSGFNSHAIEVLVPLDDPQRYKTKRIDEVLLKMVDTPRKDDVLDAVDFGFTRVDAWHALARRDGAKHFDRLMRAIKEDPEEITDVDKMMSAVTLATQQSSRRGREELLKFLQVHLKRTAFPVRALLWSAWATGLRELKPRLEQISTSGPDVVEDASMRVYGAMRELKGRCHLARKIVSLWNEEDLVTRAKLLIAFGFEHSLNVVWLDSGLCSERLNRLEQELSDVADSLSDKQRSEVLSFLRWYGKRWGEDESNQYYQEETTSLVGLLRRTLNKQVRKQ